MKGPFRQRRESALAAMFETRSDAWEAVGLELAGSQSELKAARRRLAICGLLLIAVIVAKSLALTHIKDLAKDTRVHPHGLHWIVPKSPVLIVAVICVLILGWFISRDLSRLAPTVFKRMDPATAGTVGFVIRFLAVAATVLGAFAVASVSLPALAVGGGFTAVILGLAAQQTLGNVFAGMVLLSAQPFRLGERIRLQAGATGGQLEGVVSSLGLLYTTLARGQDRIMIPNNVVIQAVIVPLREPTPVDVKIRLAPGIRPSQVQDLLDNELSESTRTAPSVVLEELDGDHAIIRVRATPEDADDHARLADLIIATLANVTGEHAVEDSRS